MPELATSCSSISRTVLPMSVVDNGGFTLGEAINCLHSSILVPAVLNTVSGHLSNSTWLYSHPIESCFSFLLLPVVHTNVEGAFQVMLAGWVGRVAVDRPVFALLLYPFEWHIGWNACHSARFGTAQTMLTYFCSPDLLVWKMRKTY